MSIWSRTMGFGGPAPRKWSRARIFARLREMGVAQVRVGFSGGNDDGGVSGIVATMADGTKQRWEESHDEGDRNDHQEMVDEIAEVVYENYGGFAGERYVSGYFLWDVAKGEVLQNAEDCD
ncbi:MAG: hypothetical protein EBS89_07445 [Proteobacteria bacterium]|nr:hypothetical protein [Pseudomonadota bacterium]